MQDDLVEGVSNTMDKYTQPNFERCAIITIDTQNDFSLPGAVAEIKGTDEVIPRMKSILEVGRSLRMLIIHVVRIYKEDGSNVDLCRRELIESGAAIVRPDSVGADLVDPIKPIEARPLHYEQLLQGTIQSIGHREWAMYKPRWGAFYETELASFLKEQQVDTLVFIGCNFPNCPRTSMYEASERDFKVVMIADAISGVYDKGLTEMMNIGVKVYTTEQFIQQIRP